MSAELTETDRLNLLDKLQAQEAGGRRKTVLLAWLSVGIATALLALLVLGSGWYLQKKQVELERITGERDKAAAELATIDRRKSDAEKELARIQAELRATKAELGETKALAAGVIGNVPQEQRKAAVEEQLNLDPKAATLLPRAYLQIVDREDRKWASDVSRMLEKAGIIVPGIEYVQAAAGLKRTDVRYYKRSEEDGAKRIVALLESAGVSARLNYLNQEDNPNVRPNHYEVWFVAGSRNTPLQPR